MKIWWLLVKSVAVALACVALAMAAYVYWAGTRPLAPGNQLYSISPGSGVAQLARQLVERKVIHEPWSPIAWAYIEGYTRHIKVGEYRFEAGMTLREMLAQTVQGKVIQYSLTLVEGWNFAQVKSALRAESKLQKTLDGLSDAQIMAALGRPRQHPEGRFFPDTYVFAAATKDIDILRQAYHRMQRHLEEAWQNRPDDAPLQSVDEALILASIIEKETAKPEERTLISAVFHNRLKHGMRLQTDPTVIYGLGDRFQGNLTRKHLRTDTPYNTYTRGGLPPTPIAMPGAAAIRAALNPADSQALYFVSRGDGSHQFSDSLEAHNRAVVKYQLRRGTRPSTASPAAGKSIP